ncbi:cation:proton antiporter domain-containing protein [Nocardia pseudobrasiliensis]|uniref:Cell volume regulation protein A n=1 Tax=Nocardia pseudobrasiliensis TaxID=45979 RepID=A0A370HPN6_9NOCA|nr:cation:proton antiporter [Nocardia pseudobrasiliensis]RDI60509.1 cell volume regulation protein A [Nocardia pseudobrasiliensis]
MNDVVPFAVMLAIVAGVGLAAVLSHRLGDRFPVPVSAVFLLGAAAASDVWPRLEAVPIEQVERVVTVALVVILFDGGMQIGWRQIRANAAAIVWIGAVGTLATAIALALTAHLVFGLDWRIALLLGTALSPTDPAVVFSVLGRRQILGRSGVLLQGESGANDPVGIALLVVLLGTTQFDWGAFGSVAGAFTVQILVGASAGLVGGLGLLWFMRTVLLPAAGLYSLRVLMCVVAIYGLTTLAHGSGFLAVLVAGIVVGDQRAPYKAEIERFHSALANLAEIVAFVMLGLTIQLTGPHGVIEGHALWIGLALAILLALVIRPMLLGALLWRVDLERGERLFVLWTGLKGAVPILLGMFILQAQVGDGRRAYEIIFVVVAFSVIVQGGAVPALARRLGVPLHTVNPRPWGMNARFEEEPESLHRFTITAGSIADGTTVADLPSDDLWISVIIRHGRLVTVTPDTVLRIGDEVLVLAEPDTATEVAALFTSPRTNSPKQAVAELATAPTPPARSLRHTLLRRYLSMRMVLRVRR